MAALRTLAIRARCIAGGLEPVRPGSSKPFWKSASCARSLRPGLGSFGASQRGFSTLDPYRTLGLERNAEDADIKRAYRDKALHWHPDRNPDNKEKAQERFAEATQAYEILKNPEQRREYDLTGRVGGPNGAPNGAPGGFRHGHPSQADAERLFREAFGQQGMGMEQIMQQLFQQQQRQQPRQRVLQAGMEVLVRPDVATIHQASRACGIGEENDERRARCAGKVGMITDTDPRDQSVKLRVMVTPGRADEVWFGAGAVALQGQDGKGAHPGPFDGGMGSFRQQGMPGTCDGRPPQPQGLAPGMEVLIQADETAIHEASRACGIDSANDARRARCAGKIGTIIDTDPQDQSLKVRVMVMPGRADEVWFGKNAVSLLPPDGAPEADARTNPSASASAF